MTQILTADLNNILSKATAAATSGSNWTSVYQAVLDALTNTTTVYDPDGMLVPLPVTKPKDNADSAAITWITGAMGVNGNTGVFANYTIRF